MGSRLVGALSGGQFQRVLFARLLLQDASLILLDEPFRAVDAKTVADLIALILRWHGEGRTVIAALHDMEQVRAHFPATLLLAREVVAWGDTRKVLTPANLCEARQLVEAFDEHAEICDARRSLARDRSRHDRRPSPSLSSSSPSCAARWWAASRCRSARRRSACS